MWEYCPSGVPSASTLKILMSGIVRSLASSWLRHSAYYGTTTPAMSRPPGRAALPRPGDAERSIRLVLVVAEVIGAEHVRGAHRRHFTDVRCVELADAVA